MPRVELDAHWFPLVLERWPAAMSDADLQTFFTDLDDLARRAQRAKTYYVVVVIGPNATLDTGQRRRLAKWVRDMPRDQRDRNAGSFVVMGSPMQRGVLSAVRWIIPELRDVHAVDSLESAVRQGLAALETKGVAAPAEAGDILRYIAERPAS